MISIRRLVIAKQAKAQPDAFAYSDDIYRYIFARIGHAEEAEDLSMEVVHAVRKMPADASTPFAKCLRMKISRHT